MEAFIGNKELEILYQTGKSKKLKLPEIVIDKFFLTIQKFNAAASISDIWADKGLHFEKLKGTANKYSVRLSGKFRLEMSVEWSDEHKTVGKFTMLTISNHYGD